MARRPAVLAVLLLAPSLAVAQATPGAGFVTVVHSADPNQNPPIVNIAQCDGTTADTLTYYWNASTSFTVGGTYEIWIADKSSSTACPAETSSTVTVHSQRIASVSATSATQSHEDDASVQTRLSQIKGTLDSFCSGTATEVNLCVNYTPSGGSKVIAATGILKIDLEVPSTPTNVRTVSGDTVLHVSWTAGSSGGSGTTSGYRVFWGPHNGDLSSSHDLTGSGSTSYDIGGLTNGTEYDVQVSALTDGKNESDRSAIVSGTPIPILDFWRLYKDEGGHEEGGCTSGAAGLAAILVVLPLALRRRRS